MHEVGVDDAWTTIATSQLINRKLASIAVINANSFVVFAGGAKKDGYLFNVDTREVKPILGSADDLEF